MKEKVRLKFRLATGDGQVERMIRSAGHEVANTGEKFDCLIWNGGADINPFIYGQKKHKNTGNLVFSRDLHEIRLFRSVPKHFPKIGICRGGQLLNCLSGGSLWQDVDGHHGRHDMWDLVNDRIIQCSSVHHQMMKPASDAILIGAAAESRFREDDLVREEFNKDNKNDWDDPEIVYYHDTNSLCVQGHPEYSTYSQFTQFFWDLVESFLFEIKEPQQEVQQLS